MTPRLSNTSRPPDTSQGELCARLIGDVLRARHPRVVVWLQTFPGLATSDVEGFRSAIGELGPWCAELRLRSASNPVVFSLTGGFKAMQGVLQALGTLYADRTVYLFEAEGSPLLTSRACQRRSTWSNRCLQTANSSAGSAPAGTCPSPSVVASPRRCWTSSASGRRLGFYGARRHGTGSLEGVG